MESATSHVRERSWSGSISIDSIISNMTPPIFHRKRGSREEEREAFHNRSQEFLKKASRYASQCAGDMKEWEGSSHTLCFSLLTGYHLGTKFANHHPPRLDASRLQKPVHFPPLTTRMMIPF
jgi:hypothetical protein